MLRLTDLVWLPLLDAGTPEPAPAGAHGVRSVSLSRHVDGESVHRIVLVETDEGFAPLARTVHVHGDADEGWDWGWRGSAPLETALNLLLRFVHPRAAWRLQWAFCDAYLHPLPPSGGILDGQRVRSWLREHAWIGLEETWPYVDEARRDALLAAERRSSRSMTPAARARRAALLLDRESSADGPEFLQAAAVLDGAPADQRWATLALLWRHRARGGDATLDAWRRSTTPGLPQPDAVARIASVWSRLVGRSPTERACVLADEILSAPEAAHWRSIPLLAFTLGAGDRHVTHGIACLAGDPVQAAATLHALAESIAGNPHLRDTAGRLGLDAVAIAECFHGAAALHANELAVRRREAENIAAVEASRLQAAEAARLPRGRSHRPPPASDMLRRWALESPFRLVRELARAGRGPSGPLRLRDALHTCGVDFPDPAGTIAATLTWYLEERDPRVLDTPTFLVRADGLAPPLYPRPRGATSSGPAASGGSGP